MTSEEWNATTSPQPMLEFLRGRASERKLRLFAVACCRRIKTMLTDKGVLAVEGAELFADGLFSERGLHAAWNSVGFPKARHRAYAASAARAVSQSVPGLDLTAHAAASAVNAVGADGNPRKSDELRHTERASQAELLRDIFNPFCFTAFDPSWRTSTVLALAQMCYTERSFDLLPILADALEDAGCEDEDILNHLREPRLHVRGCWVVDLVLDRE